MVLRINFQLTPTHETPRVNPYPANVENMVSSK